MSRRKNIKEQNDYYNSSNVRWDAYPLSKRISSKKKEANDFRWGKECINYIDLFRDRTHKNARVANLQENYELASGNGEKFLARLLKESNKVYNVDGKAVTFDIDKAHHHGVINQIVQGLAGEGYKREIIPIVKDLTKYSKNQKKEKRNQLVKQWISETFVAPVQQQVMQSMGGEEQLSQIPPEQQQQVQQQITEQVEALTPEHIRNYLKNEYTAPLEVQGQRIMNVLYEGLRVKEITDDGFEHAIITGEEYYYVGLQHGRPVMDKINPMRFHWSGSSTTEYVEDAEWAIYEKELKFSDFLNNYGDLIKAKDYKKFEELITSYGDESPTDEVEREIIAEYAKNPEAFDGLDIATPEGQRQYVSLYDEFSHRIGPHWTIRVAHCTWKAARKMYRIERLDPTTGKETYFFADENYTIDPMKGDIAGEEMWINQVWEGYKAGYGNEEALYFGIQPLPWQYRSGEFPFDVKLPYFGRKYNSLMNNAENTTIIDLAKKFQFSFDVEHTRLQRDMAGNIGKVFLMLADYIPEGYTMEKFIRFIHEHKIAPVQFHEGAPVPPQFAAQMFKDIDMSSAIDIAQRIQLLKYYQDQIAIVMYYNPSRLGQISPYVPVSNNQQNIQQSANQTEKMFRTHENIVVRSLNGLLNVARIAIKEDDTYMSDILDDVSYAHAKVPREVIASAEMGVFTTTSMNDLQNLSQFKQIVLAKAHSDANSSMVETAKLMEARSMAEAINIAEDMDAKRVEMTQQQQEAAMEQQKAMQQAQEQLEQFKAQIEIQKKEIDYKKAVDSAQIANDKWVAQNDVNDNNIADSIEREEREQIREGQREQRKYEFEGEENAKDRALKLKLDKNKPAPTKKSK